MQLIYREQIRGYPYMSIKGIAAEFECSTRTVVRRLEGIKQEIEHGRYNRYAILESGGKPRINVYVYADYEKYWAMLEDRNARKYVPKFDAAELAEICGYNQKIVTESDYVKEGTEDDKN